ncbi:MAG: alpha-amylase [Verrucomicrobiae bacterium]|nr:alpha-amylase [Verrucomicrobiae bacterium]
MLNVVILWHMHQPSYVDPSTGVALMPWVRLHAAKGYLDMIHALRDVEGARAAFNFTPVLVRQIQQLARREIRDAWHDWSRKPAADLTDPERTGILLHFFNANWDNLIRPHPRYWQLLQLRGQRVSRAEIERERHRFSTQDILDLQVWFNLAWCGFTAESMFPEIRELKLKGRGFTEDEKCAVLDAHDKILARVLEDYRGAEAAGLIETTTTPYYHPILPLVIDSDLARRCMPARAMPPRFRAPEDAREHVARAVRQHEETFGRRPSAMWPAEGSVAPEIIPMLQEHGIRLFFTDEGNLFRSLAADGRPPHHRDELFHAWACAHDGAEAAALFRERSLSDFIGFNAARNPPEAAARHLVLHLERIADATRRDDAVAALILDGENAWENFADGGRRFLRLFYEGLVKSPSLRPALPTAFIDAHPPSRRITHLHTGSWIQSDFDIWIGDEEENRAWELLGNARAFFESRATNAPEGAVARARESLLAAEGSDWFWWFGPDFHTELDFLFDELFRKHLAAIYGALGADAPPELAQPIRKGRERLVFTRPSALITPNVNGRVLSFFEYFGAGHYDTALQSGAMYQANRLTQGIWFGNDAAQFYLRIDISEITEAALDIEFVGATPVTIRIPIAPGLVADSVIRVTPDGAPEPIPARIVVADVLELAIPLTSLALRPGDTAHFSAKLIRSDVVLERHPAEGNLACPILPEEAVWQDWFV